MPRASSFARKYERELAEVKFGLQQIHALSWMDADDLMRQFITTTDSGYRQ